MNREKSKHQQWQERGATITMKANGGENTQATIIQNRRTSDEKTKEKSKENEIGRMNGWEDVRMEDEKRRIK